MRTNKRQVQFKTPKEIIEGANKLVHLDSQKQFRLEVATLLSNFLTYLKGLEQGLKPNDMPAFSMLVYGGTGSGKSHIFKELCAMCGLQVITLDGASITPPGYKGANLDISFLNAIKSLSCPSDFYEYGGVCIIDELDKIVDKNSDANPQYSFLKLLEKDYQFITEDITIPTERILFIFTGAFSGLEQTLKKKYHQSNLGFISNEYEDTYNNAPLSNATMDDFVEYGMIPELLGRIGTLTYTPPLTEKDYMKLLKGNEGNSITTIYSNLLSVHGVNLEITDKACSIISSIAMEKGQGARALSPIIHHTLISAFSKIYEEKDIKTVKIKAFKNNLKLEYIREGSRKKNKDVLHRRNSNKSFSYDLRERLYEPNGIEKLASEILNCSEIRGIDTRECMYTILKVVLLFLKLEISPDDQNSSSILKLVNCLDSESEIISRSSLDVLIDDACENKITEKEYAEMKCLYEKYKLMRNRFIEKSIKTEIERIYKIYK